MVQGRRAARHIRGHAHRRTRCFAPPRHPLRGARGAVAHHRQSDPEVPEAILGRWQDGDGFCPSKGETDGSAGRRRCYVPKRVALEILEYVDSRMPDQLLFLNAYGRPMSTVTFREAWNRVIKTEPAGPRFAGITPHVMRRAGMSMWLRQGVDLKLIQSWGGWRSLTVMLDTYAALLPGAEEDSIALLEGRRLPSRAAIRNAGAATAATTRKVETTVFTTGWSHAWVSIEAR